MKATRIARAAALLLIVTTFTFTLRAQVPQIINYQGRVAVGDPPVNFDGSGAFKFALVDGTGTASYWSNDGTSTAGGEPATAVTLTVTKGLYSVLLGDTGPGAGMTALPVSVFANPDVRLRVWFDDGVNGSQLLTPDQRITAVGYAMVAATLQPGVDISAGTFTATAFTGDGSGLTNLPSITPTAPVHEAIPQANMVWIKEGSFAMGSPGFEVGRSVDEGPQTSVTISRGFWMGIYEVTQADYLAVVGSNPSHFTGDTSRPVEQVSWHDAVAYCAALTTSERAAERCPATWSYRLPTEAEWEYAARAGRATRFSYGDDPDYTGAGNYSWYSDNSGGTTQPVGQKAPNAWVLFDMQGNVWEWCLDSWDGSENYPGGSTIDPLVTTGSSRVLRGGCWNYGAIYGRSAFRDFYAPDGASYSGGFRVVLAPGQ